MGDAAGRLAKAQAVGVLLRVGGELGQRVDRQILANHENVGRIRHDRDRGKVLQRAVIQVGIQCRRTREAARVHQQQIQAVGIGLGHEGRPDVAVGTRAVLDQHRLAPCLGQVLRHQARQYVRGAARGIGHDDAHRLGREISRNGGGAAAREHGGKGRERGSTGVTARAAQGSLQSRKHGCLLVLVVGAVAGATGRLTGNAQPRRVSAAGGRRNAAACRQPDAGCSRR